MLCDRVEKVTEDLNKHVLPPDVKVVPYYDRHDLIEETTRTVEQNLVSLNPDKPDDYFCHPVDIAEEVWHIAHQARSAWSFRSEIRPYAEVW